MRRAIFPGSFDPVHYGHIDIGRRASNLFDELIVAVYDKPSKKLVFSPEERMRLTREAFADVPNIVIKGYSGLTVDFCAEVGAKFIVRGLRVFSDFEYEFRMALANQHLSPTIDTVSLITRQEHTFLSSTTVREIASLNGNVSAMVPKHVALALEEKFSTQHNS